MLKFRYGYDTREIAKLMGISAANAAKLIQRAKQQLEKLCEEEGIL
jgi:DNA-directed RNA polymerase specialized sigma24 family protein